MSRESWTYKVWEKGDGEFGARFICTDPIPVRKEYLFESKGTAFAWIATQVLLNVSQDEADKFRTLYTAAKEEERYG